MAQAAAANFDPTAARAQFLRAQQSSRATQRPRGQVLAFPGSQIPTQLNDRPTPAVPANNNEWAEHRQRERERMRQFALPAPLPAIIEENPEILQAEGVAAGIQEYQEARRGIASQAAGMALSAARRHSQRAVEQALSKLKDEVVKKQLIKLAKKQTSQWAWRLFGRGSISETEGAFAYSWFIPGAAVTMFQSVKTLIMPEVSNPNSNDPDNGKFLKGFLAWAEPDALDPKDPFFWLLDSWGTIFIWFVLFIVFLVVNFFLAVMGIVGLGGLGIFSLFS